MPKALCLLSLVASILLLVLFGSETVLGLAGMADKAVLGSTSMLMNIAFVFFAAQLRAVLFRIGKHASKFYDVEVLPTQTYARLPIKNSVNSAPSKIIDCQFESAEDTAFKEFCNISLPIVDDQHKVDMGYYDNSVSVGHNGKFGLIPPGYFFIPEYFEYHSVIYPETSYINDTLFVTEKTWKCFAAQCIPWPVAGAGFNQMLNDFGYSTAWNLLPRHLQTFDNVKDHVERYHLQVDAVEWASRNAHIWSSDQARQLRHTNLINLIYNSTWDTRTFQQLDRLLT